MYTIYSHCSSDCACFMAGPDTTRSPWRLQSRPGDQMRFVADCCRLQVSESIEHLAEAVTDQSCGAEEAHNDRTQGTHHHENAVRSTSMTL